METNVREFLFRLEHGFCLWIGAGLTRQISGSHAAVPLWNEVTVELEKRAGIKSGSPKLGFIKKLFGAPSGNDFPKRLDKCFSRLGEKSFRAFLREQYYTRLCEAVLKQANELLESNRIATVEDQGAPKYIPANVCAVAALGQLANPIVSFNIEPLSSLLAGRPSGPVRIMVQQSQGTSLSRHEGNDRFHRLLYHPHGLATADTVMTATQYKANKQTLAFGTAIHAAFGNKLAIVGMSLDDDYLREHIERFRSSIGDIYWFNSGFGELEPWAKKTDVTCVRAPWGEFWQQWSQLRIKIDHKELATAWYLAVEEAADEAKGGGISDFADSFPVSDKLGEERESLRAAAANAGEPGTSFLIDGKQPGEIVDALRERLQSDKIDLPLITKSFTPR